MFLAYKVCHNGLINQNRYYQQKKVLYQIAKKKIIIVSIAGNDNPKHGYFLGRKRKTYDNDVENVENN